jgi:hypothetical protein
MVLVAGNLHDFAVAQMDQHAALLTACATGHRFDFVLPFHRDSPADDENSLVHVFVCGAPFIDSIRRWQCRNA